MADAKRIAKVIRRYAFKYSHRELACNYRSLVICLAKYPSPMISRGLRLVRSLLKLGAKGIQIRLPAKPETEILPRRIWYACERHADVSTLYSKSEAHALFREERIKDCKPVYRFHRWWSRSQHSYECRRLTSYELLIAGGRWPLALLLVMGMYNSAFDGLEWFTVSKCSYCMEKAKPFQREARGLTPSSDSGARPSREGKREIKSSSSRDLAALKERYAAYRKQIFPRPSHMGGCITIGMQMRGITAQSLLEEQGLWYRVSTIDRFSQWEKAGMPDVWQAPEVKTSVGPNFGPSRPNPVSGPVTVSRMLDRKVNDPLRPCLVGVAPSGAISIRHINRDDYRANMDQYSNLSLGRQTKFRKRKRRN